MKKTTLLYIKFLLLGLTQIGNAQLYTNGSISTGTITVNGTVAPASYSWSELPSDVGNALESNGSLGFSGFFNTAETSSFRLADDFVVPVGATWNITDFSFYCYQTNYTGTVPPIDALRIQLYNGDPSSGGTLIAGDMTTNVYDMANSTDALAYRILNTSIPTVTVPGTTRKIWKVRGNLTTSISSGTYWVVFQVHALDDGSIFFPSVTIAGSRGILTANGKQFVASNSLWKPIIDSGNPVTAPDVTQELPFLINANTLSVNSNSLDVGISVYPNPIKDIITISNVSDAVINSIEISDLNGRIVKKVLNTSDSEIKVSDLQTGIYLIKIMSDKGIATKKIIKE
ncbi:T9SS type A sorting domain-containing protein [Flavobacterium sp. N1994]|uniref:T9SS type A sorting domain-containing protein n=1 Tax=Flavobacterium sp. N1994 TaxID=2986827 RepID=UPI002221FCE4|nr:T9SS type A sorting domain-containing protein [Flavobacterium sp. N1994]